MMKTKIIFALLAVCLLTVHAFEVEAQTKRRRATKSSTSAAAQRASAAAATTPSAAAVTTPSGLTYLITKKGTGRQPKAGETVILHYTGTLTNGVKFDSSRDGNQPLAFKLGAGQVIKGYDEGVAKLRVGDQAILVIPAQIAYGAKGVPNVIPPDSTLIFVVEIVDVKARSLSDALSKTLSEKGVEAMTAEFHSLKNGGDPDLYIGESDLNGFGYRLLRKKQLKEAIEVLKFNVELYPQSANVYDSLGEAYMVLGDNEKAMENYQKALAIDPTMESAKQALKKLTGP
jgi:FKBP-type peptidyl-prolyl cis-trans isomerase